jgi:hypothetical protein
MAELDKGQSVSLQELMVSTPAMTDALAKLVIEKGVITDAEFTKKLREERGGQPPHPEAQHTIEIDSLINRFAQSGLGVRLEFPMYMEGLRSRAARSCKSARYGSQLR